MQKYQTTILAIFLALSAFFQYSNTLQHEYIWDDLIVITNNEKVKKGFGGKNIDEGEEFWIRVDVIQTTDKGATERVFNLNNQ